MPVSGDSGAHTADCEDVLAALRGAAGVMPDERVLQRPHVRCFDGKLLAHSMVFREPEPGVLLLFASTNGASVFVEVKRNVMPELCCGESYRLTDLIVRNHKLKSEGCEILRPVLRFSSRSTCSSITALQCPSTPHSTTLAAYEGTVTDVFAPLCMYELDGSVWLCLSYVWGRVYIDALQIGSRVQVCGAHRVDNVLVLCERGNMSITQQERGGTAAGTSSTAPAQPRPLQWLLENWQLGIADALWLRAQYHILEKKFRRLLAALSPDYEAVAIDLLLETLVRMMEPRASKHILSLKEVFLNHDERCCITREGVLAGDLLTLAQLDTGICLAVDCEDWKHRRIQYGMSPHELPLVCHLQAGCGHLLASDDTASLPLLITGDDAGALPSVLGFIVIIPVCVQVVEVFRGGSELKYLHVRLEDVLGGLDMRDVVPMVGVLCPSCHHITTLRHTCPVPHTPLLHFQLLHKTLPIMERQDQSQYCHLLGQLFDHEHQVVDHDPSVVCLTLSEEMVPLEQVLCVGGRYQLRLSSSKPLAKQQSFPDRHYNALDNTELKISCAFRLPDDVCLRLEHKDALEWPRVEECVLCHENDELHTHSLRGVLVTRRHQLPQFSSELRTTGADGYGIPGPRVMILTLRDEGGPPDKEMSVFLKNWKVLRYPLGMVPGATVICQRLVKKITADGRPYFINTKFTWLGLEHLKQ